MLSIRPPTTHSSKNKKTHTTTPHPPTHPPTPKQTHTHPTPTTTFTHPFQPTHPTTPPPNQVVADTYEPGDLVLVLDYELMLLPSLLRKRFPEMVCGFFLHCPFPSSEFYRMLPVRQQLLQVRACP